MRRTASNFIAASLPREDDDVPSQVQVPDRKTPLREPEPQPIERRASRVVEEFCPHCCQHHGPDLCETEQMDLAGSLLYDLRALGAVVTLREDGATVTIRGFKPDPETVEALKAMKPALVAILKAEVGQ